jgi:alkanesulfonate monooxygenase SsuD/methylene tetrahydromethanopterin reductase-like flavin-dependent oxidoreductase (luciferase family)
MAFQTRFGLRLPTSGSAADGDDALARLVELCTVAEASGFDTVWVPDRPADALEAYTLLGALAIRTSRLRLGPLVTSVGWRSPALVAKQVTTLDVLSGGRAVLGLGAGRVAGPLDESGAATVDRFDDLEDALRICRAMFLDEAATVAGRRHHVTDAANRPRPVQPGGVPIVVGGNGEHRSLPLAVTLADGCNLIGPPELLESRVAAVGRLCDVQGRDRATFSVTALATVVVGATAGETERRLEQFGLARQGPAGPLVVGEPSVVVAQLGRMLAAGVDGLVLDLPDGADPGALGALGRALGDAVGSDRSSSGG